VKAPSAAKGNGAMVGIAAAVLLIAGAGGFYLLAIARRDTAGASRGDDSGSRTRTRAGHAAADD
jgi:hypothetical protein